jgi:hypothetical protein
MRVIKVGADHNEDEIEIKEFQKIVLDGIEALQDVLLALEADDADALAHFSLSDHRLKHALETIQYYGLRVSEQLDDNV